MATEALDISQYHQKVKSIAQKWFLRLGGRRNARIELGDLYHEGLKGLYEARNHFDQELGRPFWAYAALRVEGAVIDYIRRLPFIKIPQQRYEEYLQYHSTMVDLTKEMNAPPTDEQLAERLNTSLEDLNRIRTLLPKIDSMDALNAEMDAPMEAPIEPLLRNKLAADFDICRNRLDDHIKFIVEAYHKGVSLQRLADMHQVGIHVVFKWRTEEYAALKACLEQKGWSVKDIVEMNLDGVLNLPT